MVDRPRQAVESASKGVEPMTQETEEILEMTEIPEEVMRDEGIEITPPE